MEKTKSPEKGYFADKENFEPWRRRSSQNQEALVQEMKTRYQEAKERAEKLKKSNKRLKQQLEENSAFVKGIKQGFEEITSKYHQCVSLNLFAG